MIDFKDVLANPEKYAPKKISEQGYKLELGIKVRAYDADSNDMNHFVGYGIVTEILDANISWAWVEGYNDGNPINYAYFCIPVQ